MTDRLTRWEGRDENGPRAFLAKEGRFPDVLQEALRKLAKLEDEEDAGCMDSLCACVLASNSDKGG